MTHLRTFALPAFFIVLEVVAIYMLISPLDPSYGLLDVWTGGVW